MRLFIARYCRPDDGHITYLCIPSRKLTRSVILASITRITVLKIHLLDLPDLY